MDFESTASLLFYFEHIDVFLVILARVAAIMVVLPVFSGANIPATIRAVFAVMLSLIAATAGFVTLDDVQYAPTAAGYFTLLAGEFVNGFTIGFVVYFMFTVFYFVGQLVDYQLGYSMVSVLDPVQQQQVPITGNMFYMFAMMLFIGTGGLDYVIRVIFESYRYVPPGWGWSVANNGVMGYMVEIMSKYMELGVKVAMPVIGTIIIIDVGLGVLVKAAPQMNVFVVGIPIKVLVGLVVVGAMLPALLQSYYMVFDLTAEYLENVVRGMGS